MIEKIKNYLFLEENREGEEDGFSIIAVYPYLGYKQTNVSLREDEQRAVEFSHSLKECNYTILVRSIEAQNDIMAILVSAGFSDVEKIEGCSIGLSNLEKEDLVISIRRRWFSLSTFEKVGDRECMVSKSGLAVKVEVPFENIRQFKTLIRGLRKNLYRNMWKNGDTFIIG